MKLLILLIVVVTVGLAVGLAPRDSWDADIGTAFFLFTRHNPNEGQRLFTQDNDSIRRSNFDPKKPIRVLIHGFQSSCESNVNQLLRSAYLESSDVNVISVDWSNGGDLWLINYATARARVGKTGEVVARFLDFLVSWGALGEVGDPYDSVTIAGHSLGAHIAGFAGKHVTLGKIHTIVGLDPAGVSFSLNRPDERLNDNDARTVHVIHTNIESVGLGFADPIGHTDFYPNYGWSQPGCWYGPLSKNSSGREAPDTCAHPLSCSHSRSYEFFAESIINNQFIGQRCSGGYNDIWWSMCRSTGVYTHMGGDPVTSEHGVFYVSTNSNAPFGRG